MHLGDTRLPPSHASHWFGHHGQCWRFVLLAAKSARDKAVLLALTGRDAPFVRARADDVLVADGTLTLSRRNVSITYAELLARNGLPSLVADAD